MATIVLSAAGMALGGSVGGSVLGLSMATLGRAAGATLGRVIDQRILGAGSDPVETGRVDRFRLTTASEGAPIGRVFGRMRVGGQVIWATRFQEASETRGGKGAGPQPRTTTFSYSVSIAIALCEGEITRVGRIWADGVEIATDTLGMRVYLGSEDQASDPKIEAVEGTDHAPAYRGLAYVVLEDLPLGQFGNRVPQFTFEVVRPSEPDADPDVADVAQQLRGAALIPGTGEYALSTSPAYLDKGFGEKLAINVNSPSGGTDFTTSIAALDEELPNCNSTLLVVSWFGDDLRCGTCQVSPKVEQSEFDVENQPWRVSGLNRENAGLVAKENDRPVYGGTPTDASVVEAIKELNSRNLNPVFYPFILMDQLGGNVLPDPYSAVTGQPNLPWRGRITLEKAPGQLGSPDQSAQATAQIQSFLGNAQPSDFEIEGDVVNFNGSQNWGYRRFILHYAHLCAAAGGVAAFCVGSEMRGLTQVRDETGGFPFVDGLRQLVRDVRSILGPNCKISYAADWSEYHGYQPGGTGDKIFNLDPLWADPDVDFIGIDNYMPLSDWRDGADHADADWESIYDLEYLSKNVAGGEGYDWFYHSQEARDAQIRTPITDSENEPWIWRYKDLKNWWGNPHHNRSDGTRSASPTAWIPESKPIWFTEFGCAAIDKGTNQPNKFLDPKSSESSLPHYSNGQRDDFLQMQYLRAIYGHYTKSENNPVSREYAGSMLSLDHLHVWAWDARPFPFFPHVSKLWSDDENYARGHWLNGRASSRTIASVISEICLAAGVSRFDVSRVYGVLRGYVVENVSSARAVLQPLMLAYGIEAAERDGILVFSNRENANASTLSKDRLAVMTEEGSELRYMRSSKAEVAGRVQVGYIDADTDYEATVSEAIHPEDRTLTVTRSEFPLALLRSEGAEIADRWIQEAEAAKDSVHFGLPPSAADYEVGDVVSFDESGIDVRYRIDRIEESGMRNIDATRIESSLYANSERASIVASMPAFTAHTPVEMLFLDLPLLNGDDALHAPYLASTSHPWSGPIAVYGSATDSDYQLMTTLTDRSVIGVTQNELLTGPVGNWDRQPGLEIKLVSGTLESRPLESVFAGANTLAICDGTASNWEVFQFANAEPSSPSVFRVSKLLRGQAGSDAAMPAIWPQGSIVVLLGQTTKRLNLPLSHRGTAYHYRYGPAAHPLNAPSYRQDTFSYNGVSLRPLSVSHLRYRPDVDGVCFDWTRRTRIDGDQWNENEVPLGEANEEYEITILQDGLIKRRLRVHEPKWLYGAAEQAVDLIAGGYTVKVAQMSDRFGAGPTKEITHLYQP